jgi:hypothetical protein
MARHLIALNLLLVAISVAAVIYTVREITSVPAATAVRPRPTPAVTPTASSESAPPPGSFGMVASRNLFSPTRTEAPPAPVAAAGAAPAAPVAKPNLYGVVLLENTPIAYLEDPSTKRVAGYRQGDTVAGGTVQLIAADHVVLTRPEGRVEVRLNDPSKPRPPAPPVAGQPGTVPVPGSAPGVAPPVVPPPPTAGLPPGTPRVPEGGAGQPGAVVQPPGVPQPAPTFPGRRPLPPNLRRLAPGTTPDAPQQ